jgi:hypothetical protein
MAHDENKFLLGNKINLFVETHMTLIYRISTDGNTTLCTSVVVPGGLPCAIPVSAIPKFHTERIK